MARQIIISSIIATVAASALVVVMRDEPAAAVAPPARDQSAEAIAALRDELQALRKDIAELRALPPGVAPAAAPAALPPAEEAPYDDEPAPAVATQEQAPTARYQAEVARAEKRFTMLSQRLRDQGRNAGWASEREAEISSLKTGHEYFRNVTFDSVECRSTLCRVVASFPNEDEQGTFEEVFVGFVPHFENASMRSIPGTNPPRTEVFFTAEGPLPH